MDRLAGHTKHTERKQKVKVPISVLVILGVMNPRDKTETELFMFFVRQASPTHSVSAFVIIVCFCLVFL